jgi:hypothetical protein
MVDLDAAFGEQLLDVAVRQRETQVPAHREDDHLGWEAEASEGRSRDGSRKWAVDAWPGHGVVTCDN